MKLSAFTRVGCDVISIQKKSGRRGWVLGCVLLGLLVGGAARAADAITLKTEVLVYADGDRVHGHLVERVGDTLVFQSEKFGLLKVSVANAHVEAGTMTTVPAALARKDAGKGKEAPGKHGEPTEPEPVGWARLSPYALTQAVREFFGPWHGRFAVSTEIVSDTTNRNSTLLEGRLQRKWTSDEVEATARYDYAKTADVTTKDVIKLNGSWRRDFPHRLFGVYRPSAEFNRAFKNAEGVFSDYILLQQEIGAGVNLFATPQRTLRAGLSENIFDVWVTSPGSQHNTHTVESVFAEVEWTLPWKMHLKERGVWYYSLTTQTDGWENRVELSKKLTETLSVSIQHETRHNNPDVRTQDYTLLRLLIGLDF